MTLGRFDFLRVAVVFLLLLSGCTLKSDELELQRAREAQVRKKPGVALKHYLRLRDISQTQETRALAILEAAKICFYDIKDYRESLVLWKSLIHLTQDKAQIYQAQKMVAEILFSHLLDYSAATTELNRFLELKPEPEDRDKARLALSKAYLYQANHYQARVEADELRKTTNSESFVFEGMRMIAASYQEEKNFEAAAQAYKSVIEKFPEPSKKESLGLNLAVIYEEQKNFTKAIEFLEGLRELYPDQGFIDRRIASLKLRAQQLPGAKGFKK